MTIGTALRKNLQYKFVSRFSSRRPAVVVNSIPKAGTHLAVQILKSAGLTFVGHFPSTIEEKLATNSENIHMFSTAHTTTWEPGNCRSVLLCRDPVDVVLSMIIYIKKRPDHPRHKLLNSLSISDASSVVLDGAQKLEPLNERYGNYYRWAEKNDVVAVDFSDMRDDPSILFSKLALNIEYMPSDLEKAKNKWNPTKRMKKLSDEVGVKNELRQLIQSKYPEIIDVYKNIKSLT